MVAFAYAKFICINVKLYILLAVLVLGMLGYFMAEAVHYRTEKNNFDVSKPTNETEMAHANFALEKEEHMRKKTMY